MKCLLSLLSCTSIIGMLLLVPPSASGQCCAECGQPHDPGPIISPRAGYVLPAQGKVNALVVFIDFEDETEDTNNVNWPRGSGPVGIGPGFKGLFIDQTPTQMSGHKFNMTTFYRDMSFGQLTIVGYPVYKRARRTYAAYQMDSVTKHNIPYWATREVLQSLTPQDVGDWRQFDSLTVNNYYSQSSEPDGAIDCVIVWYRGFRSVVTQGWKGEGIANLGDGGDYFIANGTLKVKAGNFGSGVTCQRGLIYPDCSVPFHETGHYLLGGDERETEDNYGLWTVMGVRATHVSYCMNAWEREQLGWITFREATDGLETDIPDFATTGIAYRMSYPNFDNHLEYYFENHQRLPSPYIKSAEDGILSYDVVDRFNLQGGGAAGQKGLYIIEKEVGALRVVCADGRWNWESTGQMANPFNPAVQAQIFRKSGIDRTLGKTDRRMLHGSYHNVDYNEVIFVWRDENLDQPTWTTNTRKDGDAHDAWKPDGNNIFSPWSNPAARFGYNPDLITGAMQVMAENPDGTVHVKFFTTHLESLPPARPQNPHAELTLPDSTGNKHPRLTWEPNTEPDVDADGHYEVWRNDSANGAWHLIGTAPGDAGSFLDESITIPEGVPLENRTYRYKLRAQDTQGLLSTYSEERFIHLGAPIQKRLVPDGNATALAAMVAPNPATSHASIVCTIPEVGRARLMLYDARGNMVGTIMDEYLTRGTYKSDVDIAGLASGAYTWVLRLGNISCSGTLVVRR